jgi:hypothetical protein
MSNTDLTTFKILSIKPVKKLHPYLTVSTLDNFFWLVCNSKIESFIKPKKDVDNLSIMRRLFFTRPEHIKYSGNLVVKMPEEYHLDEIQRCNNICMGLHNNNGIFLFEIVLTKLTDDGDDINFCNLIVQNPKVDILSKVITFTLLSIN